MRAFAASALVILLLTACDGGEPVNPNDPDPSVPAATGPRTPPVQGSPTGTELRDAIQQPLDRAAGVAQTLQQDAAATEAQIEAAEGGTPVDR